MYGSYGATNPPLTNNPFIANYSNRYPDISVPPTHPQPTTTTTTAQPTTWTDPTFSTGPQQQYQSDIYQQYPQVQQQQIPPGYQQPQQSQLQLPHQQPQQNYLPYQQSPPQPTSSLQPSRSFGQNIQASISGSSYGYLQDQHQPLPQAAAYNPAQQQLQNNPNYIAQFDPYGPTSQSWADSPNTPQSQPLNPPIATTNSNNNNFGHSNQNQINSGPAGFSPSGDPHPREYIRSHKKEIEAWDSYTWKQLLNSCEALKKAWESRRSDLKEKVAGLQAQLRYAGYYDRTQIQQEGGRIQGMLNDAQSNFDSVAASTFQLDEVFKGYRQSGDMSSKRRVREATNAAMQSLPKWPQS